MRILHVASECAPWAKTGGLGDVVGALPAAQREAAPDATVAVALPAYRATLQRLREARHTPEATGVVTPVPWHHGDVDVRWLRVELPSGVRLCLADCPEAFDRDALYGHDDDLWRFAGLSRAALDAAPRLLNGPLDILHAHDWHAALAPALLATTLREAHPDARSVFTLHNLAYQGVGPKELLPRLGLPWSVFHLDAAEWFDQLHLLKAGVALADAVTTVSPTFARELRTPAFGQGLDGFLRRFPIHGILNGIDTEVWSPSTDPHLAAPWDRDHLEARAATRDALHAHAGWVADDRPLLGVVSRMTHQKGLDLVADLVPELHDLRTRLVVLGTGDTTLEDRYRHLAAAHPDVLHLDLAFDGPLAHRITGGADALLVPSRFEPCGLTQMHAMAYGTMPIVHATGGLADTVIDLEAGPHATGFAFEHPTLDGLRWAVRRAVDLFRHHPDRWRAMQRTAMARDWGWGPSARAYLELYQATRPRRR